MARTFATKRHATLVAFLKKKRNDADLTQVQIAKKLGRYQSFITDYERGQKRIDAVELVQIAEAIGFDPVEAIRLIKRTK
ncbi:MAG: helix-turn-helix transcriptional regulator [Xanthobacteraceae bacterium]